MMKRTVIISVCLLLVLSVSATAQQHPNDQGNADSIFFVISQPSVAGNDSTVVAELYFYNDVQDLSSASMGFTWDNPNLQMDSAKFSPAAAAAFTMLQVVYYKSNIDTTNAHRWFQFSGAGMWVPLAHSDTPQLAATYWFHLNNWSVTDSLCLDSLTFASGVNLKFVDPDLNQYRPIFRGKECVFDPDRPQLGLLQVSPGLLEFSAMTGGPDPSSQTFTVTEADGAVIPYTSSTEAGWISLTNANNNTPNTVTVDVNIAGLAAGPYVDSIKVEANPAEVSNTPQWVKVNLNLVQGNQPPVLDPIGDKSVNERELLSFLVQASDPDEDPITLTTSTLPGGANFTPHGDGTGTFSWTPTYQQGGDDYTVTFTASDGDLIDEETITITVENVNLPPVLDPIGDKQVNEEVTLTFPVTASDSDGTTPALTADPLPAGASFDIDGGTGDGTFSWTPTNVQEGIYPVWFIASDGLAADSELVTITVIDIDVFVLSPDTLTFTAIFDGPNPNPQVVNISVSDNRNTSILLVTTSPWLTPTPPTGLTPGDYSVSVDISGLAIDSYFDSIQVIDEVVKSSGPAAVLDPAWIYVYLNVIEPAKLLAVNPGTLDFEVSIGNLTPPTKEFEVSEVGGLAIGFMVSTEASWLTLAPPSDSTPDTVTVGLDLTGVVPGDYSDSVMVSSDIAENSPVWVYVNLTVLPCPALQSPYPLVYYATIFAGETAMIADDSIYITSSGPGEIMWTTFFGGGAEQYFTIEPASGTTPGHIAIGYSRTFENEGDYTDIASIHTDLAIQDFDTCYSEIPITVNVKVYRPPSADTVVVSTVPAVPGMKVTVPVLFTNSCPLSSLYARLKWESSEIHLDSVSFAGSAVDYIVNKSADIDNSLGTVALHAEVGNQMMIPIGSLQLWADLHFALSCEIIEDDYPIAVIDPDTSIYFTRDCGAGVEAEIPEFIAGNTVVGSGTDFVCGYVVDPDMNEIPGATVELWTEYPSDGPHMSTTTSGIGSFAFDSISVNPPYDLYAYMEGYYPGTLKDLNFGAKGVIIVLEPLEDMIPTSEWVDYYCPDSSSTFMGASLPVGAVVEAYTPAGLLVGQKMVTQKGKYGFMPVYRASDQFGDDGAVTGDLITFRINGMTAEATGDIVYPPEYAQMQVCLEVRGVIIKECVLAEGWNLVSWNVDTDSDNIMTVLGPYMECIEVILGFEQGGLTFDPDLQEFSTLWMVDHLSGYWIKVKAGCQVTLAIEGLPVPLLATTIPVYPGWNLVSYLLDVPYVIDPELANIEDYLLYAYGWDNEILIYQPGAGQFNTLTELRPCNGYWLKLTEAAYLAYLDMIPIPGTPGPQQRLALSSAPGVAASTQWVNLYSHHLAVNNATVTSGTTVRAYTVDSDRLIGSYTMTTNGKFGFMPVYADDNSEATTGMRAGDQFYLQVGDVVTDEKFTWTANGDRIEIASLSTANSIGESSLPGDYSLGQNYPNPFNPFTHIQFVMPQAGKARIEVFNILGRLIATPFDDEAAAGENTVIWDGRNSVGEPVASGVYLYRLTADNYSETKKMMLLK